MKKVLFLLTLITLVFASCEKDKVKHPKDNYLAGKTYALVDSIFDSFGIFCRVETTYFSFNSNWTVDFVDYYSSNGVRCNDKYNIFGDSVVIYIDDKMKRWEYEMKYLGDSLYVHTDGSNHCYQYMIYLQK